MYVLVTGGTGFIGSALVKRLLKQEAMVGVLARDERKLDASLRKKVEIYKADISDLTSLELSLSSGKNMDVLFHLAACTDYEAGGEKLFRTNVTGTLNLLNLAIKQGIKKFVFASSIEAIGPVKKEDIPANETHACQPVNLYGESKLWAEREVAKFRSQGKLDTVILRLGNVYGPGSLSFISRIVSAISSKDNRYLYVNRNRYSWHPVYIEDAIDGIMKAAGRKGTSDVYILTGAEYVTVGFLSHLIAQKLNIDVRTLELNELEKLYLRLQRKVNNFYHLLVRADEKRIHWIYSIEKAKKNLGYRPKVRLKEGITKTLEWAERQGLLKR